MSAIYQDQEFVITEQVYVKCSDELYLESLLSKWEDEEYTPEQEDMLWDESYRYDSDLLEAEENQMI